LGVLVRRFGERRLAALGLASATFGFVAWGLAPVGWMVYATTVATALMHATTPSLKAIVSKATEPAQQGATLGSFDAIYSLMAVLGPPIGTQLLGLAVARGGSGPALGIVFFVGAALNAAAWLLFTRVPTAVGAPSSVAEPA
jgi:DHA1 family tetracycline resistance protein-like MFS transporter